MARFCRVPGDQAGPEALGILVPPAPRTMVILRPRGLDWDLLPLKPGADAATRNPFWEADRAQATAVADKLALALEQGDVAALPPQPVSDLFYVGVEVGGLPLLACLRQPGQAYQALAFATREEADAVALGLVDILCPPADANRELYLNTRNFAR
jgi:hypothetical protein